ncbi:MULTISPECIES: sulfite exporter TauE/SafE family protein [unclassified Roseitalea]|uniref:sulfite exporter TauE/SafE family protein n=1 Tax=unclassified Roseitalea TaxID=2639107 RepID=UPI00273ECBCE|nr:MULTISPECIES: sulfite exporter TauE/SafE family protein [unclassified Roseitalea]
MSIPAIEFGPSFWTVLAAIAVAGMVRGFSGFGTGMIVGPVAAAAYSPQLAVAIILILDTLPMLPLVVAASKKVRFGEIAPVVVGYGLALPPGLWFLTTGDPVTLRWFICAVILLAATVLWSGWCYRGPRTVPVRLAVGGASGFLGGATSVSGPPVILYWMALRTGAGFVRANLTVYFFAAQVFTYIGLYVSGVLTVRAVVLGLVFCPVYFAGLVLGARLFGHASEAIYRNIALSIVSLAAVIALPAFDGLRS